MLLDSSHETPSVFSDEGIVRDDPEEARDWTSVNTCENKTARVAVAERRFILGVETRALRMSGGDPFHRVPHRANRQYNQQNPDFSNRPAPRHFHHNSKWPTPQVWGKGMESLRPPLPYAEDTYGNDKSLPLMPRHDQGLTAETLLAALSDDADLLRDLLSRGAGTECRTDSGATPLICAAAKGSNAAIEVLLECDANVVATDKIGANALTLAACHGRVDTALKLINSKNVAESEGALDALLKWRTNGGETPLMAAAKNGHAEFVTMLLEVIRGTTYPLFPYDDGSRDPHGVTAMQLACRKGKLETVKALVAGGALIAERSGPRGMTTLMHAACQGHVEIVKFLLNPSESLEPTFRQHNEGQHQGADVLAKDADGLTSLLHAACATGVGPLSVDRCEASYRCFLTLAHAWPGGADAAWRATDKKGRTPMMCAARFGNEKVFKLALAEMGAPSLAEFDAHGESTLFNAIKGGFVGTGSIAKTALRLYPVHEDLLEMIEVRNKDGLTPLLWCAAHGRTEAAKWCVKNGADILKEDLKGRLPRQIAEARGHPATAQALSELAREKWLKL